MLFIFIFVFLAFEAYASPPKCAKILKADEEFTGKCEGTWDEVVSDLKPTQAQVGYAWVMRKVYHDFSTAKDAQEEMEDEVPVVLGPHNSFYLVDDHHTLSALSYSGFNDTVVSLFVTCDLRARFRDDLDGFFDYMVSKNLVYLKSHPLVNDQTAANIDANDGVSYYNQLPVDIDWKQLPAYFSFTASNMSFSDDPWRALVGFSRKANMDSTTHQCDGDSYKYCLRCMLRSCNDAGRGQPFFEFKWAQMLNRGSIFDYNMWGSLGDDNDGLAGREGFLSVYNSLNISALFPGSPAVAEVDLSEWAHAASILIELCRSRAAQPLPGAVLDYTELDKDPSCDLPTC
jgi:hypothetical protein